MNTSHAFKTVGAKASASSIGAGTLESAQARRAEVVGIDASRNRSGGAKGHLVGILRDSSPLDYGIRQIHVWSYRGLLDLLPEQPWLIRHNPPQLEGSLPSQVWWQRTVLPKEAHRLGCDVLLNTDAGSVCRFSPSVVMSRDMLSYEPGEMRRYGPSKARARLALLYYIQNRSLRAADGVIFLTRYASSVIQRATGPLSNVAVIPHGVSESFRNGALRAPWPSVGERPVRCLYVSNAAMYKHQWSVVRAFGELRRRGHAVRLTLAGGGSGPARRLMDDAIRETDLNGEFINCIGFVAPDALPALLADADLFVFASSCENMPNTLVEAMASGLPIACAARGPMPEVLGDEGVFFNPEEPGSIAQAVERLLVDAALRKRCAQLASERSRQFSWSRCGNETWQFLLATAQRAKVS